ncbi:MAG: PilZ domain-containing protein [Thermodesulfobacteriota bacterium]
MTGNERRRYSRHETEIAVTILKDNDAIAAIMTDISEGGIGIISERGIYPGTEVTIKINNIADYSIQGTVKWVYLLNKEDTISYRIGIEADRILVTENILGAGWPGRSGQIK